MEKLIVLLFYKFQEINDVEYFVRAHRRFCKSIEVLGKVLVAHEGINGSISGTNEQVEKYKKFVWSLKGFEDVWFKEEFVLEHPFTKMHVRIRKEIIRLNKNIDLTKKGKKITPKEFIDLYKKNENFMVLDARNYYESKLGKFKNAITSNIRSFREFPKFIKKFEKITDKKKKIVMYCTGGIRCEKASAYMKERGFENVYQLDGGIINFCQQYPNTIWEGKCFVFDKRLMTDINQKNKPITHCINCNKLCDLQRNCKNISCDELVIMCVKCQEKLHGCCSEFCKIEFEKYSIERSIRKKLNKEIEF